MTCEGDTLRLTIPSDDLLPHALGDPLQLYKLTPLIPYQVVSLRNSLWCSSMNACPECLSFPHIPYKTANYSNVYTEALLTRLAKISSKNFFMLVKKPPQTTAIWKMVLNVALWQNGSIGRALMTIISLRHWEQRKIEGIHEDDFEF